jgi:hypothetical protein
MTYVAGVIGAALLFGLFSMLRPSEAQCTGQCAGCTRDGACRSTDGDMPNDDARNSE